MKVYCEDCKYYTGSCIHPSNLRQEDTYRTVEMKMIAAPYTINKSNDCANYRRSIWWWIK